MALMARRARYFLFFLALAWPPIHFLASEHFGFSSWRLFGWGMYATPHPESLANLNLVFLHDDFDFGSELGQAYSEFRSTQEMDPEGDCLRIFRKKEGIPIEEFRLRSLCRDGALREQIAIFDHYDTTSSLEGVVSKIIDKLKQDPDTTILVVLSRQRVRPSAAEAYVENELFSFSRKKIQHLGKFY